MTSRRVWDCGSIMVWVDDGWLSNLEIDWQTGDAPLEFPALPTIARWEGYRA